MSPTRSSVTPSTYTFRVRILGGVYAPPDGRQIWRELELTGNQTLADLGEAIPLAFGFDDPHLWSFFLSGKPWDDVTEYARSPSPDRAADRQARTADRLHIHDAPAGKEFLFLFDYGDEWHFGVRLVRTGAAPEPGVRYPQVVASHGQAPAQYPPVEDDWDEQTEDDEEFLAQWEQAEAEAVEVLRQALPAPTLAPLPAGELTAACQHLRAGLGRHDPAINTIRRAAGLDPPLPADDVELWLAAAGALIAMREPSGLEPELEASVMALELADWLGAVIGLVRGGVGASADPEALVAAINDCPEVDGTVDPDDADLVELAFEVVVPTWEAVGAVDADRRLTALGAWGLPRALARAWGSDFDTT
jgi:Plasmid pRiA4b ORF-3-like protein